MKIDKLKIEVTMARACMKAADIAEKSKMPRSTVNAAISGRSCSTKTIGKIARVLNVDVIEIIETKKEQTQ